MTVGQTKEQLEFVDYCVSGRANGNSIKMQFRETFHRVRDDFDQRRTRTPNKAPERRLPKQGPGHCVKQHVRGGAAQPGHHFWQVCSSASTNADVPFDDCNFDDRDQASAIRNRVEDVDQARL